MRLATRLFGRSWRFKGLAEVLAKANEEKSGDRLAGLAAASEEERVAAKAVLAEVTVGEVYERPSVPYDRDEVTRVIVDAIDRRAHRRVAGWTVARLREWLLSAEATGEAILALSPGLTSEAIAAVARLMSNLELIQVASKIEVVTRNRGTVGRRGTLGARLQPNHPKDDVEGILASIREGLSYGSGDALIGINPVTDDAETTARLLRTTADAIERWRVPTQNCVLAHVTTQMEALRRGAPMDVMFQSLAGTEAGNRAFGITVATLDEADAMIRERGSAPGPHRMYFETGEGSELSAKAHEGVDQLTLEARCYGLARRYRPFLVNTVVGFIGPEYLYDARQIARAGLEDHFMGKLHGLPMGADACYTNHAAADQNDVESLAVLLTAAGCSYFMGVPMGDDCMLAYQCTSFHDVATLRETLGKRPGPEFERWMERRGLMRRGRLTSRAGDPTVFR